MIHSERLEDVPLDIGIETLSAHLLHDEPSEGNSIVGIGCVHPWRPNSTGYIPPQCFVQRQESLDSCRKQLHVDVFEASRVGDEMAQRDRLREGGRYSEALQIGVHVRVQ